MADVYDSAWSETDSSNTSSAPDGAPEGMAPSGVNDVLRAHQGAIKRYVDQNIPKTSGGSTSAYTLTYDVAPGALVNGMTHMVQFHAANSSGATLNVNSLGAKPIQYYAAGAWRAVPPSLWGPDWIAPVTYNSSAGAYRLIGFDNRTGTIEAWSGTTEPYGAVFCYGQTLNRTTYAGLFAVQGETYGAGNGSTNFKTVDARGYVLAGKDNMGGTAAGRLTDPVDGTVLGDTGGSEEGQLPQHKHTLTDPGHNHDLDMTRGGLGGSGSGQVMQDNAAGTAVSDDATTGITMANAGTSTAHNVQPTIVLNKVVRI